MKNLVILIGSLGKNVEITKFDSGRELATLSLATNKTYKNKLNEVVKLTLWHRISVWNPNRLVQTLEKGDTIYLEGEINYREYTDKEGNKKTITEINAQKIVPLTTKHRPDQEEIAPYEKDTLENFDDLPF